MDNINQVNVATAANKKVKLLLYVDKSQMNSGKTISKEKVQRSESSLLHKIIVVGGGALILTNIISITLASFKAYELLISP